MKNNILKIFLFVLTVCSLSSAQAQSISRSVICAFGTSQGSSTGTILSTFGQCPGCGTVSDTDGNNTLTQGFQQASGINADCFDLAAFDVQINETSCGTSYSFLYLGGADSIATTFEWNFGFDAFPQTSSAINPMGISFASVGTKTISLTVSNATCDVSENLTIEATELAFAANAIVTNISCKGDETGSILLESNNGAAPFSFIWSNGNNTVINENLAAGDYGYTIIDANNCQTSNMVTVSEPENDLSAIFDITNATCDESQDGIIQANVSGGTEPYSYNWSNSDLIANTIAGVEKGDFNLIVTDANGCTVAQEGTVGEACNPIIYNIFSPNDDGNNETWIIEGIENYPNNDVKIYNRWGNLVYGTTSYTNDWNGTDNNGDKLLAGAYYYVVVLENGGENVLTGSITIIR